MSYAAANLARSQACPSPSAKLVLITLANYHNAETGMCFPSIETLTVETGLSRSTVIRSIKALRKAGIIDRQRSNRSNSYSLNLALPQCHGDTPESVMVIPKVVPRSVMVELPEVSPCDSRKCHGDTLIGKEQVKKSEDEYLPHFNSGAKTPEAPPEPEPVTRPLAPTQPGLSEFGGPNKGTFLAAAGLLNPAFPASAAGLLWEHWEAKGWRDGCNRDVTRTWRKNIALPLTRSFAMQLLRDFKSNITVNDDPFTTPPPPQAILDAAWLAIQGALPAPAWDVLVRNPLRLKEMSKAHPALVSYLPKYPDYMIQP